MINQSYKEAKPFLKWAGGKGQLINQIEKNLPQSIKVSRKINKYFEPFVGGGAVAFHILSNYKPKNVYLFDINEELINCYNQIKFNPSKLILRLQEHKNKHNEDYFYKIRTQNPKELNELERASRFIYLNKTCFNGLYRVNSKGGFNVPIGSSKNPAILPEEDLKLISKLLKNVTIRHMSFERVLDYTKKIKPLKRILNN